MLKKVNYKKGMNHRILWYYSEKKSSNEDMSELTEEKKRHKPLFSERFTDFCNFQCLLLLDT